METYQLERRVSRKRLSYHLDPDGRSDRTGRHSHHRNVGQARIGLKHLNQTKAAHHRHDEVDEHERRPLETNVLESLLTVGSRAYLVALLAKHELERFAQRLVIFDDEDRHTTSIPRIRPYGVRLAGATPHF